MASKRKAEDSWKTDFNPTNIIVIHDPEDKREKEIGVHAYHGNNIKSKIAIITEDANAERERIEDLKLNGGYGGKQCDKITWIPPIEIPVQPDVEAVKKKYWPQVAQT